MQFPRIWYKRNEADMHLFLNWVFWVTILFFFVKILNSVGCRRVVSVFLVNIGIKTMITVSYCDFFTYLGEGDPTETEYSDKTNGYDGSCIVFRPGKLNRQRKMGTSDGNALQVI